MSKKTEKLYDILIALRDFERTHEARRNGKTYKVIHHKQLMVLISDFVGYTAMPNRHTLNRWLNDVVYTKEWLISNNSKSYERREYTFNMPKILSWIAKYEEEQRHMYKKVTAKNKQKNQPHIPTSKQSNLLKYYQGQQQTLPKKINLLRNTLKDSAIQKIFS